MTAFLIKKYSSFSQKKVRKKFSYDPEKKLPDHCACIIGKIVNQNKGPQSLLIMKPKSIQKIEPLDVFILKNLSFRFLNS